MKQRTFYMYNKKHNPGFSKCISELKNKQAPFRAMAQSQLHQLRVVELLFMGGTHSAFTITMMSGKGRQ